MKLEHAIENKEFTIKWELETLSKDVKAFQKRSMIKEADFTAELRDVGSIAYDMKVIISLAQQILNSCDKIDNARDALLTLESIKTTIGEGK